MTVRETVNATKTRFGEADLAELFDGATKIVAAKGKKVLEFDPRKDDPADIAAAALGPSGNLRAPSFRAGKTWYVGFSEQTYTDRFG